MVDQFSIYLLLFVFATGLFITARGAWKSVSSKSVSGGWLDKLTLVLFVLSLGLVAFEWLGESYLRQAGLVRALTGGLGLGGWMGLTVAASKALLQKSAKNWGWGVSIALLILSSSGISYWSYDRFGRLFNHYVVFNLDANIGAVLPSNDFEGFADNGEKVELFSFSTDDQLFDEFAGSFSLRHGRFENALIETAVADMNANCHGWVFTEGRFLLRGTGVETILRANRYRIVTEPKPNDIVIYRDVTGKILHTALVQAVLSNGTVITESKWGIDKRVLHRPEDQPYSARYDFYRTERPSHSIRIAEVELAEGEIRFTSGGATRAGDAQH
jgi:hypothetical protein